MHYNCTESVNAVLHYYSGGRTDDDDSIISLPAASLFHHVISFFSNCFFLHFLKVNNHNSNSGFTVTRECYRSVIEVFSGAT